MLTLADAAVVVLSVLLRLPLHSLRCLCCYWHVCKVLVLFSAHMHARMISGRKQPAAVATVAGHAAPVTVSCDDANATGAASS